MMRRAPLPNEAQRLTLAEEFSETKDWFVQHKRDPFLWLVILGPLLLAAGTFWGVFVFPPSDPIRPIKQVLPNANVFMVPKNFPKCRGKKYVFGYDVSIKTDANPNSPAESVGRICRDVINGEWVWEIGNPKFEYLEPR